AIGCTPAVEWLASSGLDLADGVVCDGHGLAAPDVFAVGDVAAWRDGESGAFRRAEHYLNAMEQAQAVARTIATGEYSPRPLPFFWSEVFGVRIQGYGIFGGGGTLTRVAGDDRTGTAADRFVAESRTPDGTCVGIVGWNLPREFRLARDRVGTVPSSSPVELVGASKGPSS
ncbi:MAG: NAD(P)/FAD-dependent oxidoreductase, partial [Frondihabitans sp.]|nr:NAD(P)/FAD-dependent oxidoreductase [Frondihabitans sp.]